MTCTDIKCAAFAAAILVLMNVQALAGAITVSPIRVELTPRRPVATLEVRNEGDDFVTVQIEKMDWSQVEGSDSYSTSSALLATPSVFELPPHGTQTLRIGIRDPQPGGGERAFRLYAAEVLPDNPTDDAGLRMALRIGIPIFAEPASGSPHLVGNLTPLPDGKLALHLRNTGARFVRTTSIDLQNAAGKTLWRDAHPAYVLASGEHVWIIDSLGARPQTGEHLQLALVTEDGRERVDIALGL